MPKDVFLSYSKPDRATADDLCRLLEARGVSCWIAPRDVPPGRVFDEEIIDAIDGSSAMVLVLSSNANQSPYVTNEVNRAFGQGKSIFTFRVEDVAPSKSLQLYLARHQWTDAFPPPVEEKTDRLAAAIVALLGRNAPTSEHSSPPPPAAEADIVRSPNVYVVRTRSTCGATALYDRPDFATRGRGSLEVVRLRDGDVGRLLDQAQDDWSNVWYRVQLENGKDGWYSKCGGSEVQIGGSDPRVFLTLTTASGKQSDGYLKKRELADTDTVERDDGIVTIGDVVDFEDSETGRTKLQWSQISSIVVTDPNTTEIATVHGGIYRPVDRFGLVSATRRIEVGFQLYRDQRFELSLWLATKDGDLKLAELRRGAKLTKPT